MISFHGIDRHMKINLGKETHNINIAVHDFIRSLVLFKVNALVQRTRTEQTTSLSLCPWTHAVLGSLPWLSFCPSLHQSQDRNLRVITELLKGVSELAHKLAGKGVEGLGAVEVKDSDA
jgi:hypothetical protein